AGSVDAACAEPRRCRLGLVHAQRTRCRALPAEHARRRSADRRLHEWPNRLRPAVPWRGTLPRTSGWALSLRLQQSSRRKHHRPARIQRGAGHPVRPGDQGGLDAAVDRRSTRVVVVSEARRMTVISYMTNVLFENGALAELGPRLPSLGISRPMI